MYIPERSTPDPMNTSASVFTLVSYFTVRVVILEVISSVLVPNSTFPLYTFKVLLPEPNNLMGALDASADVPELLTVMAVVSAFKLMYILGDPAGVPGPL